MLDPDVVFEIGFVIKDVVVVPEREDGLDCLPHKFFNVFQQFTETLTNFRGLMFRVVQVHSDPLTSSPT